jgi:hypothetical protein
MQASVIRPEAEVQVIKRPEICTWLAFAVLFAFALFPPWVEIVSIGDGSPQMHRELWQAPLWRSSIDEEYDAKVDHPRMFTEIAVSECFVLTLYLVWGRRGRRIEDEAEARYDS